MPTSKASKLLRPGLLQGTSIVLACAGSDRGPPGAAREAAHAAFTELGARVHVSELIADGQLVGEDAVDRSVQQALAEGQRIDMLLVDGAGIFAACGAGRDGLRICLEATWGVTRAVASAALIPAGKGRIAYVAPAPGVGAHASACCAGLENLARTLSIEWARHGITPVVLAAGEDTDAAELAALAAYLASPAGAYFSGCLLDLAGP